MEVVASLDIRPGNVAVSKTGRVFATIHILTPDGKLSNLIQDERLQWPDNVDLSSDGWIYISVNQLNTTPAFTGAGDEGKPPYYIYRFRRVGKK
ncbi:hypothetical protein [Dawidia soli]|uniref:Uncharacterized protein n=1 Tax=Dawidia soli TaxID=2782352 RepID=A0AAP2DDY5_9BACT|nr:hypothetical protein [Dawidia soli]MBT1689396.1 hypothetical protein [Dawidia soli]